MTAVYLFTGILVVLLLVVVLGALRERAGEVARPEALAPDERRDAALDALREIEFERGTGKLSEEEYRRLHDHYARMAIAARDEAAAPEERAEAAAPVVCPACRAPARPDARFCSKCGAPLATALPHAPGPGSDAAAAPPRSAGGRTAPEHDDVEGREEVDA